LSNLCNSTSGTGERSCTFNSPWTDNDNNTIYCRLDDSYNVSSEKIVNLTADNTIPVINSVTHSPDKLVPGQNTTISANVTDNQNVNSVWVNILSTNYTMTLLEGLYNLSHNTTGEHGVVTYTVYANDTSNNLAASVSGNYTVNALPTLTSISVSPSTAMQGELLNVSTTGASDADSDSYILRCGNETTFSNLCNSTSGTGERSCTMTITQSTAD